MNDSTPRTPREIRIDDGWTIPAEDGVHRRTLVKGSAWTVPVLALSVATPAAAASGSPTLAFTQSSYSGKACGTITGVQVKRTTDGSTADPGKVVTVRLADGYTFADGSTTVSRTTGTDGLVTLPDITVPSTGGDSAFKAASDSLTTSARVSSTASDKTGIYLYDYKNSAKDSTGPIKDSAKAIKLISTNGGGAFIYQNSDGSLHTSDGGIVKGTTSGVDTGAGLVSITNELYCYKKSDGIYFYNYKTGATSGPVKDSSDAIKLISTNGGGAFIYQNSDGSLHTSDGGIVKGTTSGVDTGAGLVSITNELYCYKKSDGIYFYNYKTGATSGPVKDSSDAIKLISTNGGGAFIYQNSDGSLHTSDGGIVKGTTSGVDTGAGLVSITNELYCYKKSDGIYFYNYKDGSTKGPLDSSATAQTLISSNGGAAFIFQNTDGTVRTSDGKIVPGAASDVDKGADLVSLTAELYAYKKSPACS